MAKYKIIEEFVLNGIVQKKDSIVELDFQKANLKSIQKNIEKVIGVAANTPVDGSVLGNLTPGKELTPEQKEKLAKENLAETVEAQRLAGEQRTRDIAEGRGEPVVKVVADALKQKLTMEEFEKKEDINPLPANPLNETPPTN